MGYAYDLLYVTIGNEEVGARPTKWDREDVTGDGLDSSGVDVIPIGWMTTCPSCADLVNILKPQLYIAKDDTEFCMKCPTCETGKELKQQQFIVGPKPGPKMKTSPDIAEFIDPIKEGFFDGLVDHDLLITLDEELVKLF